MGTISLTSSIRDWKHRNSNKYAICWKSRAVRYTPIEIKNYNIKLATLVINLELKNKLSNEVLYKNIVSDIFGYANSLEKAGINAYQSEKLNAKLGEAMIG